MKKVFALFFLVMFLAACQSQSNPTQRTMNGVIKNKEVINEMTRLQALAEKTNLTVADFDHLKELTKDDTYFQDQLKEIFWLIEHDQQEHAGHGLEFLQEYALTGEQQECLPHELSHVRLYIIYNDTAMSEAAIQDLPDLQEWIDHSEQVRKNFPQYYRNFDQIKVEAQDAVTRLQNKDYSQETLDEIQDVENNAPC